MRYSRNSQVAYLRFWLLVGQNRLFVAFAAPTKLSSSSFNLFLLLLATRFLSTGYPLSLSSQLYSALGGPGDARTFVPECYFPSISIRVHTELQIASDHINPWNWQSRPITINMVQYRPNYLPNLNHDKIAKKIQKMENKRQNWQNLIKMNKFSKKQERKNTKFD